MNNAPAKNPVHNPSGRWTYRKKLQLTIDRKDKPEKRTRLVVNFGNQRGFVKIAILKICISIQMFA